MLKRFWDWSRKLFGLPERISELSGKGFSTRYSEPLLTTILFNAMMMRLPSLNAAELSLRNNSRAWRKLLGATVLPSADTLGRGLEKSDISGLRSIIRRTNHDLRRAKAFDTASSSSGLIVAAIDGHETFASELRCCDACMTRKKNWR
jgi:hypothetical protein